MTLTQGQLYEVNCGSSERPQWEVARYVRNADVTRFHVLITEPEGRRIFAHDSCIKDSIAEQHAQRNGG